MIGEAVDGFGALSGDDVDIGQVEPRGPGDMANMLGETDAEDEAIRVTVRNPGAREVENGYPETHPGDEGRRIVIYENPDHPERPRAVVFQDSFCEALKPYLAEGFSRVAFVWSDCVRMDYVLAEKADVVIQEYVERFSPAMRLRPMEKSENFGQSEPAEDLPKSSGKMRQCVDRFEQDGESVTIVGWAFLPGRDAKAGEVSVALKKGDETVFFAASSVNRPDVTSYFRDEVGDNLDGSGFSASFTTQGLDAGHWKVYIVLTGRDGVSDCVSARCTVEVE